MFANRFSYFSYPLFMMAKKTKTVKTDPEELVIKTFDSPEVAICNPIETIRL